MQPLDACAWGVDLLSISGHKLYGPKGIGALYIRDGARSHRVMPRTFGGGQEWEIRPGTLNVPGIIGLGTACEIAAEAEPDEAVRIATLRDLLEDLLLEHVPGSHINGNLKGRLPGNSSISFPTIDAHALLANLPTIALSTGSACTSGAIEPSHVLQAMGISRETADSTVRFGLGRYTTEEEVRTTAHQIVTACNRLSTSSRRLGTGDATDEMPSALTDKD